MRQSALLASLLLAIPAASHALGFGRVANNTVLGQPLDVSVVVSAEPNQDPPLGCVHAEVFAGDSRLPSSAVNVRLDGASGAEPALIRVGSAVRIDEPVVTVVLTVGCASRLSRSFVLFVDPPVVGGPNGDPSTLAPAERSDAQPPWLVGQAATMPTDVGSIQAQSQAQTQAAAQPADPAATGGPKRARTGGASSGKSEPRKLDTDRPKEGSSSRDQAEKEAAAAARKARRLAAAKAKEADRAASREGSSRGGAGKEGGPKSGDRKLADAADGSRLRLEAPEALSAPIPTAPAPAPAASMAALAASVAMASELAASQAESLEQAQRKIRDLEADLQRLRSLIASAPAPVAPVKAPAATRTGASWLGQDVWAIGASALVALLLVGLYALWRRARGSDEESLWWATQVGPTGRKAPELDGESMAVSQMEPPMTENGPAAYSDDPGLRQAQPAPLEQDSTFEPPPGSTAVPGVRRNEFATSEFSTFRSANSLDGRPACDLQSADGTQFCFRRAAPAATRPGPATLCLHAGCGCASQGIGCGRGAPAVEPRIG
jgi:pilus assembly protein FimV